MMKLTLGLFVAAVAGCAVTPGGEGQTGGEDPEIGSQQEALVTAVPVKVTNDSTEPVPVTGTVTCSGCGGGSGPDLMTVTIFDETGSVDAFGTADLGYADVSAYRNVRVFLEQVVGENVGVQIYICWEVGKCALWGGGANGPNGTIGTFHINEMPGRFLRIELQGSIEPATARVVLQARAN
jgi:hypothetical protein